MRLYVDPSLLSPHHICPPKTRPLILEYLHETEPHAVAGRLKKKFKRNRFYAAGVNHLWAFDQHDKFKRFGLFFHLCIDPFCGFLLWLTVWWSNSNPRLWAREYINAARRINGESLFLLYTPIYKKAYLIDEISFQVFL